jgi:hypothetical protein
MDYQKIYNSLIERSKNRLVEGYSEKHHIIPRCLGGTNEEENITRLTAEEHYLAHQLLVKMYPKNFKLIRAMHMMTVNSNYTIRNNKSFGWIRRQNAIAMSVSIKVYQKENGHPRGMAGKTNTIASNIKRSGSMKGIPCPSRGVRGPRGSRASPLKVVCRLDNRKELDMANFMAYCKRLDNPAKAIEQDANRSKATKGIPKPQEKVKCPHCLLIGGANIMKHHHFDNCKKKKEEHV